MLIRFLSIAVQCYRKLEIGGSSPAEKLFSESIFLRLESVGANCTEVYTYKDAPEYKRL